MSDARDRWLRSAERRHDTIEDTPWGDFEIQSISEIERSSVHTDILEDDGEINRDKQRLINAAFIQLCLVEKVGDKYTKVFLKEDIPIIASADSMLTKRVMDRIEKHCGLGDEAKQIDVMEKNLKGTGGDTSTSNSPTDAAELMSTSS